MVVVVGMGTVVVVVVVVGGCELVVVVVVGCGLAVVVVVVCGLAVVVVDAPGAAVVVVVDEVLVVDEVAAPVDVVFDDAAVVVVLECLEVWWAATGGSEALPPVWSTRAASRDTIRQALAPIQIPLYRRPDPPPWCSKTNSSWRGKAPGLPGVEPRSDHVPSSSMCVHSLSGGPRGQASAATPLPTRTLPPARIAPPTDPTPPLEHQQGHTVGRRG